MAKTIQPVQKEFTLTEEETRKVQAAFIKQQGLIKLIETLGDNVSNKILDRYTAAQHEYEQAGLELVTRFRPEVLNGNYNWSCDFNKNIFIIDRV